MGTVGFVFMLLGALQMANGIMTFIASRNPARVIESAKQAGVPAEQLQKLEQVFATEGLFTPVTVTALSVLLSGLVLLLIGVWTQKAAGGFAGIVLTRGQDISRLMDALSALRQKYSLIYYLMMFAALSMLVSLGVSIYRHWNAG
jgi:hypothetical protein